jgi:uncharacterized membrane-anchored protein YjiN (DUF445 family)
MFETIKRQMEKTKPNNYFNNTLLTCGIACVTVFTTMGVYYLTKDYVYDCIKLECVNFSNNVITDLLNDDEFIEKIDDFIENQIANVNNNSNIRNEISKLLKHHLNKLLHDKTCKTNITNTLNEILSDDEFKNLSENILKNFALKTFSLK